MIVARTPRIGWIGRWILASVASGPATLRTLQRARFGTRDILVRRGRSRLRVTIPRGNAGGLGRSLRALHRHGLIVGRTVVSPETRRTAIEWSLTDEGRLLHATLSSRGGPHG